MFSIKTVISVKPVIFTFYLGGESDFVSSFHIGMLALKNRQNKNQKPRIIMFVGSPVRHSIEELLAIGKKVRDNTISVNIISYGNVDENKEKLEKFINYVNRDNNSCLVSVQLGNNIFDTILSSSLGMVGDNQDQGMDYMAGGGSGGNVGGGQSQLETDLAKAFAESRATNEEEERKRKEAQAPKNDDEKKDTTTPTEKKGEDPEEKLTEEELLMKALKMSEVEYTKQEQEVKKKEGIL